MYKTHTLEEYNMVMKLRKRFGWSAIRISSFLSKQGINLSKGTISGWIRRNKKPFEERLVNRIPKRSKFLNEEKAYVLGVLCGDGYISSGYRIGLAVCDKDFAEFFKRCLEKNYCLSSTIRIRKRKNPNAKLQHIVSLVSKRVVEDLHRYLGSFKTKEWAVPNQIKNSNKNIVASFLRGLYDSEGSVRFRRNGYGLVQFYSSNSKAILDIKKLLKNIFNINSKIRQRKGCPILEVTYYEDIKKFYEEINFGIVRKQTKLVQLMGSYKRGSIVHHPLEIKMKAMELLKQGYTHREIAKMLKINYTSIYDWERKFMTIGEGIKDV